MSFYDMIILFFGVLIIKTMKTKVSNDPITLHDNGIN